MPSPTAGIFPSKDSEIIELIKKAQQGDSKAKEKVFFEHLPLAQQYAKVYSEKGVPYEDLYQEACYGILVALDKFDPDRGTSFRTYSDSYIKKFIHNSLITQNTNLPSSYDRVLYYEIKHYIEIVEKLTQDYGHPPSVQEVATYMNISPVRVNRLKRASHMFMVPSSNLDDINNFTDPFGTSSNRSMEDSIIDHLDFINLRNTLTPRQFEVLERRLGFTESGEPEKWAYISAQMGYSIDTLRNDFQIAILKIRRAFGIPEK